jgi:hypothetical protein
MTCVTRPFVVVVVVVAAKICRVSVCSCAMTPVLPVSRQSDHTAGSVRSSGLIEQRGFKRFSC